MPAETKPVFIVSSPRSGSTLLRLMIDAHPAIAIPPPDWLIELVYPYLYSYGGLRSESNLLALAEDILETPTVKKWPLKLSAKELLSFAPSRDFAGLYEGLHLAHARREGKPRWGEKSPRCSFWIDELKAMFSDAQFIHIIRDGRDTAIDLSDSASMLPFSIYSAGLLWQRYVKAIRESAERLSRSSYLEVRYEDLCADPRKAMGAVCAFLGEDFSERMLTPHDTPSAKNWSSLENHAKTGMPITTEYCRMFERRLTGHDIAQLNDAIGGTLRLFDYPVDGVERVASRLAAQLIEADTVTSLTNAGYKRWHEERRKARRDAGVWRDSDRDGHLWAVN